MRRNGILFLDKEVRSDDNVWTFSGILEPGGKVEVVNLCGDVSDNMVGFSYALGQLLMSKRRYSRYLWTDQAVVHVTH